MTDHVLLQIDAKSNAGIGLALTTFTIVMEAVTTLVEKGLLSREKRDALIEHAEKVNKEFRRLRMAHHPAHAEENAELFFGVLQMLMQIMAWMPVESLMEVKAVFKDIIENQMKQNEALANGRQKGAESNKKKAADVKKLFLAIFTDHCRKHSFSTVDEHVAYVLEWAEKNNITVGGEYREVSYQGDLYRVTVNGKKPCGNAKFYRPSYIRNLTKGVKTTLK